MDNIDNEKLGSLLGLISSKLGTTSETLQEAINSENLSSSLKNVSKEDMSKLTQVLSDKEKTAKILSTPKAQELLKNLLKEKHDG